MHISRYRTLPWGLNEKPKYNINFWFIKTWEGWGQEGPQTQDEWRKETFDVSLARDTLPFDVVFMQYQGKICWLMKWNGNIYPTTRSWIAVFDLGQILHCWNWLLMSNVAQKLKLQQPTFPGWHTAIPAKRLPRLCCLAHGKSGVWPLKTECQVSSIVEAQIESEQDTDKITGINKKVWGRQTFTHRPERHFYHWPTLSPDTYFSRHEHRKQ